MENLKINTQNEFQQKQIEKLFIELGVKHELFQFNFKYIYFDTGADNKLHGGWNSYDFNSSKFKEITLPELRDLVVLRRNDPKDATHYRSDGKEYFQTSDKERHYHFQDDAWVLSTWMNYQLLPQLQPIEKKEMKAKEYLKKIGNDEYTLMDGAGYSGQDNWIEVPDGADIYIGLTGKINGFYKDNFKQTYLDDDDGWVDTTAGNSYEWLRNTILWKRNPEPKQAEFLVKTDGGYVLQVLDENAGGADVMRVPDGAEIAIEYTDGRIYFWTGKDSCKWVDGELIKSKYPDCLTSKQFLDEWPNSKVLWKRETLNDQVASAEEYREMISNAASIGRVSVVADIAQSCGGVGVDVSLQGKSEFPLNNFELNHRVAKAFNAVRGTDLNEDDVNYIRELINLTVSHYGERK